jgi:hypothetical protein
MDPSPRATVAALATLLSVLAPGTAAWAEEVPAQHHRIVGLGWKVGNGLGPRGADLVVAPWPSLAFELHVAALREEVDEPTPDEPTGWGIVPLARLYPLANRSNATGVTPHVSAGVHYSRWEFGALRWSRTELVVNGGPEWRWSGLRLLLGAGIHYARRGLRRSNGSEWVEVDGGRPLLNLEAGLRYMFR